MRILFFGKLRDTLGECVEVASDRGETIAQLRRRLTALHPEASDMLLGPLTRACVGDSIVAEDFVLTGEESVEFLPPVSGG
jgi:molybdopterin converting factor small subunit